jgi:hypothetical protein
VLEERVPFLKAPPLAEDEHESYGLPTGAGEDGTLFEHCIRAIERGLTAGAHGLPLFGAGDWNDGMNRVGHHGRGESTWLGFFLHGILKDFAEEAGGRGDHARRDRYRSEAGRLASRLEDAWDGEWYRRGYYDDGTPLGSAQNDECRIDSIAQSWAVLSGAVPQHFAERAMDAVRTALVSRGSQLLLLLDPPFDRSTQDPGYIKGYPPGVRENGGQYTHAAAWVVMALARLGGGDEVAEIFHMLNPINHARTPAGVEHYKAEPYVLAGDVYAGAPHAGRAGWSWYTGSAAWMYRAGVESMLGLRRHGDSFTIDPCIPASWPGYEIAWRVGATKYLIAVENPHRQCRGVARVTLDDADVPGGAIPLAYDGETHRVRVVLGASSPGDADSRDDQPAMAREPPALSLLRLRSTSTPSSTQQAFRTAFGTLKINSSLLGVVLDDGSRRRLLGLLGDPHLFHHRRWRVRGLCAGRERVPFSHEAPLLRRAKLLEHQIDSRDALVVGIASVDRHAGRIAGRRKRRCSKRHGPAMRRCVYYWARPGLSLSRLSVLRASSRNCILARLMFNTSAVAATVASVACRTSSAARRAASPASRSASLSCLSSSISRRFCS